MKCLVTGAAGMMGSHLTDCLIQQGHQVIAVDNLAGGKREYVNPKADYWAVDLRDKYAVNLMMHRVGKLDTIYHLAAHACEGQSIFNPAFTVESNVLGFLNLFTAALKEGFETFVFTSSMAVYGDQSLNPYAEPSGLLKGYLPLQKGFLEDQARTPVDPYGLTKANIERLLEIYRREFEFNYVIFRPHNVYGTHQNLEDPYRNVLGIWMNRIMNGKPPIIYGDGEQTRAFTYIDDCSPVIANSISTPHAYNQIFNIGSDKVVTLNKACEIVMDAMGFEGEPIYAPERPLEVKHAWCNHQKAKNILGYQPSTPFAVGVKKMAEWAKSVGPKPFKYWSREFEITRKVPEVWSEKQL